MESIASGVMGPSLVRRARLASRAAIRVTGVAIARIAAAILVTRVAIGLVRVAIGLIHPA